MTKSITDFIEEYVNGEPLTNGTVAWAIRKYIYMNFEPTKQEKLTTYEALLHDIGDDINHGSKNLNRIVTNIHAWDEVRRKPFTLDKADQIAMENESFYNLRKTY